MTIGCRVKTTSWSELTGGQGQDYVLELVMVWTSISGAGSWLRSASSTPGRPLYGGEDFMVEW